MLGVVCADETVGSAFHSKYLDINIFLTNLFTVNEKGQDRPLYFHWTVKQLLTLLIPKNQTPLFPLELKISLI